MEKIIHSIKIVGSNVMELQTALTSMNGHARMASGGLHGGSSCIEVEDNDGNELAEVHLIEETLSDGSKVYNVRLRFSNIE